MQTNLTKSAGTWDSATGAFISEDMKTMATILHDYDARYSLVWIPPRDREVGDFKPYAIIETTDQFGQQVIRWMSELEMKDPTHILAEIFEGDLRKHNANEVYARIYAKESAERLMKAKQAEEDAMARQDLFEFAAKTPLHTWRHNGRRFDS